MLSNLVVSLAIVLCVAQCGQSLPKVCTLEYFPICGSDGNTYGNQCFFDHAVKKNSALTVAFYGSCEEGPRNSKNGACTLEYFPICGSDGNTYGNQCFFNQAVKKNSALTVAFYGSCEEGQRNSKNGVCTLEYFPICGSDGKTYGNQCFFNQAVKKNSALTVAFYGSCEEGPRNSRNGACTLEYFPICGSDGNTYGNQCFFNQAVKKNSALTVAFYGSCEEGQRNSKNGACTLEYFPICGSDGNTYGNQCFFNQAVKKNSALTVAFYGSCEEGQRNSKNGACTLEYFPICGSDGKTYGNQCFFDYAVKKNSALTVAFYGSCEEGQRNSKNGACTLEYFPICGSDGNTYGNQCFFDHAVKRNPALTVAFYGSCEEGPRTSRNGVCTLEYFPICGSDGNTYGNQCFFDHAVKRNPALTVAFYGSCEEGPRNSKNGACTLEYFPICGSDGNTYGNQCFFDHAVKKNSALTVAFYGSCEEGQRNSKNGACTLEYFPICGSDGKTYGNQCFFDHAVKKNSALTVAFYGSCEEGQRNSKNGACTLEYFPICGSDGKTYGNQCFFDYAVKKNSALTVAFYGSCEEGPRNSKNGACTLEYFPICGSDGNTYGNQCFFNQAVKKNSALTVAFYGSCEEGQRSSKNGACTLEYFPICGSDGKTYGNQCFFDYAVKKNSALTVAFYGSCEEGPRNSKNGACTLEYFPICGSDGNTYGNQCFFNQAVKKNSALTVAFYGSCEEGQRNSKNGACTLEYFPICGSDGKTYGNQCFFDYAVKKNPALTVAFYGTC